MKMNPVVHFEIPYEDKNRVADFYKKAFGWKMEMMGPEMGEYVVASTSEVDPETRLPKEPGRINGGFYKKTADPSSHAPSVVVAVDDIREGMKKVTEAGGTIIGGGNKSGEPDNIPGVGMYCSFRDSEGNRMSLLEPSTNMESWPK